MKRTTHRLKAIAAMRAFSLFALFAILATVFAAAPTHAATIAVTSLADDGGAGELRAAINQANTDGGGDTITFATGLTGNDYAD